MDDMKTSSVPPEKQFQESVAREIGAMIDSAQKIVLISHRNPDGDTSGSGLAMRLILEERGKQVTNVCVDPLPTSFRYMPNAALFEQEFSPVDFDLIITVDAAVKQQTGLHEILPELFDGSVSLINIDHHISNTLFGTVNLVEADACSTTAVLWKMLDVLGWHVSSKAATCLLNGLMTDTGSLQHSNATPESFRIAARMLAAGANLQKIRKNVFQTTPLSTLRLWGRILNRMTMNDQGVVVSTVQEEDFAVTGADPKDTAGVIDYLNMVPRAKYSLLLTERKGVVKGSFRTQRDDVNVSDIAGNFGGGGHVKAAGFTKSGRLEVDPRFRIVSAV